MCPRKIPASSSVTEGIIEVILTIVESVQKRLLEVGDSFGDGFWLCGPGFLYVWIWLSHAFGFLLLPIYIIQRGDFWKPSVNSRNQLLNLYIFKH